MLSAPLALSALLALAPLASAHGWLARVAIDSTIYTGPIPSIPAASSANAPSPIRTLADYGPLTDPSAADMACGNGAHAPAALVAPASPGARVAFQWTGVAGAWIHPYGPMQTYMAACAGTTCDQFDAAKAQWFKVDAIGQSSPGQNEWFQNYVHENNSVTITLPTDLKAGDYLLRHELIALHNAQTAGKAEFYPSCTQIRLSGAGTASPPASELVKFPGAYAPTDPGLLVNIYTTPLHYAMPGGPLSALAAGRSAITVPLPATNGTADAEKREVHAAAHRMRRAAKRHA